MDGWNVNLDFSLAVQAPPVDDITENWEQCKLFFEMGSISHFMFILKFRHYHSTTLDLKKSSSYIWQIPSFQVKFWISAIGIFLMWASFAF